MYYYNGIWLVQYITIFNKCSQKYCHGMHDAEVFTEEWNIIYMCTTKQCEVGDGTMWRV
jgi:hypothetical protein